LSENNHSNTKKLIIQSTFITRGQGVEAKTSGLQGKGQDQAHDYFFSFSAVFDVVEAEVSFRRPRPWYQAKEIN